MPSGDPSFQVVILAGGECKRLYPLTSVQSGLPKALLPVGNRPLISYPLKNLVEGGIKNALVVSLQYIHGHGGHVRIIAAFGIG